MNVIIRRCILVILEAVLIGNVALPWQPRFAKHLRSLSKCHFFLLLYIPHFFLRFGWINVYLFILINFVHFNEFSVARIGNSEIQDGGSKMEALIYIYIFVFWDGRMTDLQLFEKSLSCLMLVVPVWSFQMIICPWMKLSTQWEMREMQAWLSGGRTDKQKKDAMAKVKSQCQSCGLAVCSKEKLWMWSRNKDENVTISYIISYF